MWCRCIWCIYRENTARLTGTLQISSCSCRAPCAFRVIVLSSKLWGAFGAFRAFIVKTLLGWLKFSRYQSCSSRAVWCSLTSFYAEVCPPRALCAFRAFFVKTLQGWLIISRYRSCSSRAVWCSSTSFYAEFCSPRAFKKKWWRNSKFLVT